MTLISTCISVSAASEQSPISNAQLVILMDDMGHSLSSNQAALNLPGAVSFAFLPYAHFSRQLAREANALNKDVLLHAPMQSIHKKKLGIGGLTSDLSEQQFKHKLRKSIAIVPHLKGVNNHMGSKLTSLKLQMQWTMDVLKEQGLFFVDSKTTAQSVAWQTAQQRGVASLKRDVFLDHKLSLPAIKKQYAKALKIAKVHGRALLIAHPHAMSIQFLQRQLPLLKQQQIELVSLSSLLTKIASEDVRASVTKSNIEALN